MKEKIHITPEQFEKEVVATDEVAAVIDSLLSNRGYYLEYGDNHFNLNPDGTVDVEWGRAEGEGPFGDMYGPGEKHVMRRGEKGKFDEVQYFIDSIYDTVDEIKENQDVLDKYDEIMGDDSIEQREATKEELAKALFRTRLFRKYSEKLKKIKN